jgi:hypothetical protein
MASFRRITLVLSITALLAVPAAAQADVGDDLSQASNALDRAAAAAKRGDVAAFKGAATTHRKLTGKAARKARRVSSQSKRAKLMRQVAGSYDAGIDRFAALIDVVPAGVQPFVAGSLDLGVEAREQVVEMLLALAERLPEPARTAVIDAVARFSADGELEDLFAALTSGDVIAGVRTMIQEQIAAISAHLDEILAQFEELAGVLPPQAGQVLQGAIAMIQDHLAGVSEMIGSLLDGLGGGGLFGGGGLLGGLFGGGGLFGSFGGGAVCDLFGGLPFPVSFCD